MKKRQWLNGNHIQCVIKEFEQSDKEKEKEEELVNLMELVIEENREALEELA